MEGGFDLRLLLAAGGEVQPETGLPQTPHFDHAGYRPWERIKNMVHDDGIEFVGKRAWGPVEVVRGHGPPEVDLALRVRLHIWMVTRPRLLRL